MVEVAFDTSSDVAGVALTADGALVSELTWLARQSHSRDLLPALETLLARARHTKTDITALFVCVGPGSYAGLRVGLSTAKGLAYALGLPLAGVGRLAADAEPLAVDERRVLAVHTAGRAELAWAAYERGGDVMVELTPPRLSPRTAFVEEVQAGDLVCGELDPVLVEEIRMRGAAWTAPHPARVVSVARLGWQRLQAGDVDDADGLTPLYLREPAIGPQSSPA